MTDTKINDISLVNGILTYDISPDLSGDSGALIETEIAWIVALPGKVVETNAPQQDGNILTWPLVIGQANHIRAVSQAGRYNMNRFNIFYILGGIALMCMCCAVPLVIAVTTFFFLRKKKANAHEEPVVSPA